jgi:dimethylamine monooxygenase subunit A
VALPESEVAQEEAMRLIARALNADRPEGSGPPLARAARLTFEDLCIVEERDREYVLTAGVLSFPTDWLLQTKIGLPIRAVHAAVPDYEDRIADGVDYFFQATPAGPVFERANWFVVDSDVLRFLPEHPPEVRFAGLTAENAGERLVVRCERQTLRRLPMTGAFLFTIGIYQCHLHALATDLVQDLSEAVLDLPEREAARRYAPFYAQPLADYAMLRPGTV